MSERDEAARATLVASAMRAAAERLAAALGGCAHGRIGLCEPRGVALTRALAAEVGAGIITQPCQLGVIEAMRWEHVGIELACQGTRPMVVEDLGGER